MATLILQDGTCFAGEGFGGSAPVTGEVVFVTDAFGYQQRLTDPAYRGQILCFTYPMIGNVGVCAEDMASPRVQAAGLIVQSLCDQPNNWRCEGALPDFLAERGVPGMQGVDTRALARHLRDHGAQRGRICAGEPTQADWDALSAEPEADLVAQVTCRAPYALPGTGVRVAVLDLGVDAEALRALKLRGCAAAVYPAATPATEMLAAPCEGVLLSGGPGDPAAQAHLLDTVRALMAAKPVLGIGLGLELMTLARGGGVRRLSHGCHGNQPVREAATGRCEQAAQHRLYGIDPDRLPSGARITHTNLNDGSIAGLAFESPHGASGVLFRPSAEPGGTGAVYDAFVARLTAKEECPHA